jgi:predicted alpha/beta-fold hydrolase
VGRVREASTLAQFEDVVTAPLHGFRDAQDYYERASAEPNLPGIRVPTLLLNARNDPFLPEEVLRDVEALRLPPELVLEFPQQGGHGGFPSTDGWLGRRVLGFLDS